MNAKWKSEVPKRTILFPGLAADYRVFSGLNGLETFDWIDYSNIDFNRSENEVIDEIIKEYNIVANDRLIATSLGGILASRIATKIGNKNVILLGAVINNNEFRWYIKLATIFIEFINVKLHVLPFWIIKCAFGVGSLDGKIIVEMADKYSSHQIKAMLKFILKAKEIELHAAMRVHGKFDMMIKPKTNAIMIKAGHVITMKNTNHDIDQYR